MAQLKDLIVNGNTRLIGDTHASTPAVSDDSDKVATTEWVKDQGYTTTSGTVTSVTLKATSPIAIDSTAAITTTGTRTLSHANSGATAGSYGDSAAQTPAYGGTFKVPYVTVNATGHVTGISEHTVKIPASDNTDTKVTAVGNHYTPSGGSATTPSSSGTATRGSTVVMTGITKDAAGHVTGVTGYTLPASDNTDTKVKQTLITTNDDYPVILKNSTTATDSPTAVTNYAAAVKVNPSTGNLTVTKINGVAVGSAPKFTDNNTTYTFANGTNGFTVTPSGGSAQTVVVTPSITNNVTGSGTSGYIAKFNGANTITNGPAIGTSTTTYLRNDGTWATPPNTDTNTVPTAYCSTAAGTAAKAATCTGYVLTAKTHIMVNMTTANSAASAITLNINSQGAKSIYINGAASSASNYTLPAGTYLVYYDGTNYYFRTDGKMTGSITGDAATVGGFTVAKSVPSNAVFTDTKVTSAASTANANYPILINNGTAATTNTVLFKSTVNVNPSTGTLTADKVVGGVWNDYAEYRKCDIKEPGYVVCEDGTGKLELSTEKMQACPYVISDTFGFAIGDQENGAPIALSGRALVYTDKPTDIYKVGDVLCAGENGTAHKMSRK